MVIIFSIQCVLSVVWRGTWWAICRITEDDVYSTVSELTSNFEHYFYKGIASERDCWIVSWLDKNKAKHIFKSYKAVEARSLDRGLRIIKNEMKNNITLHNSNNR